MILPYILSVLAFCVELLAGFLYPAYESILLLKENRDFVKSAKKRGSYETYSAYMQWLFFWCLSVIIHLIANMLSFIYMMRVIKVVALVALSHPRITGANTLYRMIFVDPRSKKKIKELKAIIKAKIRDFSNNYGISLFNKFL